MKALMGHALLFSEKNSFARYPLLSVAFIFMMSLILFRHLGGATLF
jgi:hypothetical protein